jgi:exopolysaccharide biosynthesis predicted pyruvyltransferase EpsI
VTPPDPATHRTPSRSPAGERHALLRRQATAALAELVTPGSRCALVDFPMHANVGDSAIWVGERALLREAGATVVYACDIQSFSEAALTARLPADGTIFLSGGGNLGDLWPQNQKLRERVIQAFPGHRIIQLPQSAHFGDRANLDRARAVFDGHPDLTLLVRDHHSLDVTRKKFRARSLLCPDFAFALTDLTDLPGLFRSQRRILWLSRTDHEAADQSLSSCMPGVYRTDWTADEGADRTWAEQLRTVHQACRAAAVELRADPTDRTVRDLCEAYDHHAELHVLRGCGLLSSGRAVVTDRLHGHLLSLLLGLPHVVLNDRYSKVRGFWETWTSDWPAASWANTPEQALGQAERLADT